MSRLDDAINKLAYQEWPEDWVDCGNSGVKHEQNYSRRLFFIKAVKSGHTLEVLREVDEVKALLKQIHYSKRALENNTFCESCDYCDNAMNKRAYDRSVKILNKWNKGDGDGK